MRLRVAIDCGQGFTRDQVWSHPLSMMPWNRLFCLDNPNLTLKLLSSPYNGISTYKLLFGTIFELGELLGDGQALSWDNELAKAISRTALMLDMSR